MLAAEARVLTQVELLVLVALVAVALEQHQQLPLLAHLGQQIRAEEQVAAVNLALAVQAALAL
jgi:hypothetical protein